MRSGGVVPASRQVALRMRSGGVVPATQSKDAEWRCCDSRTHAVEGCGVAVLFRHAVEGCGVAVLFPPRSRRMRSGGVVPARQSKVAPRTGQSPPLRLRAAHDCDPALKMKRSILSGVAVLFPPRSRRMRSGGVVPATQSKDAEWRRCSATQSKDAERPDRAAAPSTAGCRPMRISAQGAPAGKYLLQQEATHVPKEMSRPGRGTRRR